MRSSDASETVRPDRTADLIRERARRRPLIVLDDEQTGTQTVRDVTVLTSWTEARLRDVFPSGAPATYLLPWRVFQRLPDGRASGMRGSERRHHGLGLAGRHHAVLEPLEKDNRALQPLSGIDG